MPITYRPARTEDLPRANELVVASINDLCQRHGFGRMATLRPPAFAAFSLRDEPDGLWVAEVSDQIAGFAFSWVCGDLWFLAQLFVAPGQQTRGIGQELLRRTLEYAEKRKAASKALITFSFNSVSQGLYMWHGLFPRCPIYNFTISRNALASEAKSERLRYAPISNSAAHLHELATIDVAVLGVSRAKHHSFLAADGATRGELLYMGQECVGYAYICEGHIGPLAVSQRRALGPAFRTALDLAAESGAPQVTALIPGSSEPALRMAVAARMRITTPMVLMATRELRDWVQYLPRSPGFM